MSCLRGHRSQSLRLTTLRNPYRTETRTGRDLSSPHLRFGRILVRPWSRALSESRKASLPCCAFASCPRGSVYPTRRGTSRTLLLQQMLVSPKALTGGVPPLPAREPPLALCGRTLIGL